MAFSAAPLKLEDALIRCCRSLLASQPFSEGMSCVTWIPAVIQSHSMSLSLCQSLVPRMQLLRPETTVVTASYLN